jgi:hypothetical protein
MLLRQIQGGKYTVVWPSNAAAAQLVFPREAHY